MSFMRALIVIFTTGFIFACIAMLSVEHSFASQESATHGVNFTDAFFVVVIMTLSSSRPILKLTEGIMARIAGRLGGTIAAWWFAILTLGPMLGSFITGPAAMTISALLLKKKIYVLEPSRKLKYATIALLFVYR